MSDTTAPRIKYDAFVSFRGEDIRDNFLSHLLDAFDRKKIHAFVDDQLERGEEIWPSLVGAIEGSFISLIIFSEHYTTSRWCLQELVHIMECRKKYKQTVIPVFYRVNPTDVRHQMGSYENVFREHGNKFNPIKVQSWRDALNLPIDLPGIVSSNLRNDAKLIDEIMSLGLTRLSLRKNSVNSKRLIGIEERIAHLKPLLSKKLEDTRVIGIWSMGGIGKTTTVEAIFNELSSEYEGGCFLKNVREESTRHGISFLKEKLFSSLLKEDVKVNTANGLPNHVEKRVLRMKVFIVLDDVNDSRQLEILVGNCDSFGSGSKIIITTRDKQVLAEEVDDIYQVEELNFKEGLELFNLISFKQNHLKKEKYCELSEKVVRYAKGIPLVLKVLGHLLRGKDKVIWDSQLNKLQKMPPKSVYDALKLSYSDLDHKEQNILLDLACFFHGLNLKVADIKSLLKEGENDNSVAIGLERLRDRALIAFSEHNSVVYVSMHDIIKEMCWGIVFQECPKDLGRRSQLWDAGDICEVLNNDKGSGAIKSLRIPFSIVGMLKLSPYTFARMSKLQFLHVPGKFDEGDNDLLPRVLQFLSTELRYLCWWFYPLKTLPEKFSAEKLVFLDFSWSKLEKLWHGVQNLKNLKEVRLYSLYFLKELPDFTRATNLEVLDIRLCKQLSNVHPSIFSLEKLHKLNLRLCTSLTKLTSDTYLRSPSYLKLRYLCVRNCEVLKTLPELPLSLEILHAQNCSALETIRFPSSIEQLRENRKRVLFWNCMKLDEDSLVAVGLNEQINMKKFASKHLPAPECDSFANNGDDSCQVVYVYPGCRVPEWFVCNKITEDYIVIDLSAASSPILGFIFCFVLCKLELFDVDIIINITICDDEGKDKGDCVRMSIDSEDFYMVECDHVCVMYDQGCSHDLISRAKNLTRYNLKVTTEIRIGSLVLTGRIGRFGVYPINTTAYHDFIQKMD